MRCLSSVVLGLLVAAAASGPSASAGPPNAAAAGDLGRAPRLFGRLAGAAFGMSREQFSKAAPELFDRRNPPAEPILYGLDFDGDRGLQGVDLHFLEPQPGVLRQLTVLWGKPARCTPLHPSLEGRTLFVWRNPVDRVRATLRVDTGGGSRTLSLTRYATVAELLGPTGSGRFGFEGPRSLIGARSSDLRARWGADLCREAGQWSLLLPPAGLGEPVRVRLEMEGRTVVGFRLEIPYADCREAHAQLVDSLEKRLAVPKGVREVRRGGRLIRIGDTGRALVVLVSRSR